MTKERKHFTPEEKVAILRRHLADKVPVSELCEELGLRPTVFYRPAEETVRERRRRFSVSGASPNRVRYTRTGDDIVATKSVPPHY